MDIIQTKNITYNDTPEVRLFSSQKFNWCLDKQSGISCCWGQTIKETPQYDPLSPQELIYKIINFDLTKYIQYFNFLANIKYKKDNQIKDIPKNLNVFKNLNNLICMSTFGNIIFNIENLNIINDDFIQYINYIKNFNINPKIQLSNINNLNLHINKLKWITTNIILSVSSDFYFKDLYTIINTLEKEKFNICIKLVVNKNNIVEINKFLQNVNKNLPIILYIEAPYLNTRKYLEFQTKCLNNNLTNVCLSQCSKFHYSKDIIGSILLEQPCSFCKYSIYIIDNQIYTCDKNKIFIGKIEDFNTIFDFWNCEKVIAIRQSLIDKNKCQKK